MSSRFGSLARKLSGAQSMEPNQLEILSSSEECFFTSDPMERYEHNQARLAAVKEIMKLREQLEELQNTLQSAKSD